jgi:hypothetical protein
MAHIEVTLLVTLIVAQRAIRSVERWATLKPSISHKTIEQDQGQNRLRWFTDGTESFKRGEYPWERQEHEHQVCCWCWHY